MSGRVLVSNRGEGNFTNNTVSDGDAIYFPHGATNKTIPSDAECFGADFDHLGWGAKSNWIIQYVLASSSGTTRAWAMRPTGQLELIHGFTVDETRGGVGGEEIYGPVKYFKFERSSSTPVGSFYVIAWNEGDINS